ncbi:hypothetical protein [Streptomyces albidoflavus]|uniref:hypothetical protein n=1 Tax=Streptomyces albidoflavus TaxID=1886 RepID=UPI0004CC7227|nr:hypothetical protein [Streptomyces albidoflavus]
MKVWRVGHRTMVIDGIHIGPYRHRTYRVPDADVHCGENGQVVFCMGSAMMADVLPLNLDPVQLEIPGVNL